MDIQGLHRLIDEWAANQPDSTGEIVPEKPARTDGKRAVRTKSTGDRVYLIDDEKKTKAWITSPEILEELGFSASDVVEVEDKELISYQMGPSIFKV